MSNYSTAGYVYLIRSDSGHYKIGKAKDPNRRVSDFTLQLPFKVEIIHLIPCDDYSASEKFLHHLFRAYHVNGEWFKPPQKAVDFLLEFFPRLSTTDLADWKGEWSENGEPFGDVALVFMAEGEDAADRYVAEIRRQGRPCQWGQGR